MISFAVTAYNEMSEGRLNGRRLLDCIYVAQYHQAVDDIVIVDDGSGDYTELLHLLGDAKWLWPPLAYKAKLRIYHSGENRGVFANKLEAIALCRRDWIVTCDSDNLMGRPFIDNIVSRQKDRDTWYCPSFARPEFDYRALVGEYDLHNIAAMLEKPMAECALNTGNQTVHREAFMDVFGRYRQKRADLMMPNWLKLAYEDRQKKYWRLVFDACDSFIFNLTWLSAGKTLAIVKGLEYEHYYTCGPESNYARSPEEKQQLSEILMRELKGKAA